MMPKSPDFHDSAITHVQGKSEFIDDRALQSGELHVEVFYSPEAHAEIISLDFEQALACPGVVAIFTAKDLQHNIWGTIFKDQPVLAVHKVNFVGEPIALIAANTKDQAIAAKLQVKAKFKKLNPILSIQQAKALKSFIGSTRSIACGDAASAFEKAPHQISGSIVIRGAEHFYLESQAALAIPKEDGQLEIHSSSQHPTEVQHVVADSLGLASKDVVSIVKRMGGGFGGKESQAAPIAAFAALVAQKTGRAARVILTKDDDMIMTGKRNPFENQYRVGFDSQGRILSLEADLYSDGGAYADLSTSIMERAMLHIDNAYFIPNVRVSGTVCRTNFHPHTAFRGFGGPKGVATIEKIIEEIALKLGIDPLDVRKINCYSDGKNKTPYGQELVNNCLPQIFSDLEKKSQYRQQRKLVKELNQKSVSQGGRFIYGLSMLPVKFGISFTTRFLNQANALVIIHRDGSIQASTGATEMGQGVNARIAKLIADEFGLSRDSVRMMATSTERNANTSPTAASSGTDLNGAAAVLAARKLKFRLSELAAQALKIPKEKWAKLTAGLGTENEIEVTNSWTSNDPNQDADWKTGQSCFFGIQFENGFVFHQAKPSHKVLFSDLVYEAYHQRISLSEYAHYKIPNLSFNKLTGRGNAFLYFTQGAACSRVKIDRYTGETKVEKVDISMDLGRPVNEALDLGQVAGAFVQGMGWVTTEKLFYDQAGLLKSHSPSTYKIPNIQDTPREFNMDLFTNDNNLVNVRGTKAVGEPPLLLALSVWTAIQDAIIGFHRQGKASVAYPTCEIPATNEEIIKALYPEKFNANNDGSPHERP